MKRIGGKLDARGLEILAGTDADYLARANLHRPALAKIRTEALRLLASGLSVRDVASALRLSDDVVAGWAAEVGRE